MEPLSILIGEQTHSSRNPLNLNTQPPSSPTPIGEQTHSKPIEVVETQNLVTSSLHGHGDMGSNEASGTDDEDGEAGVGAASSRVSDMVLPIGATIGAKRLARVRASRRREKGKRSKDEREKNEKNKKQPKTRKRKN